jgi:ParB-like chromosome segregation protein Spo0J
VRLSVSEVDWSQLSERARWALDNVIPLQAEGDKLPAIAKELGVDVADVAAARDLLEAEAQALADRIVLPQLTEEEYEALKESIATFGQIYPILLGSDAKIVDGRNRDKACRELKLEPKTVMLDLPADQLQSLALAVNVARRHLTAGARRGIARAELLRDPSRSDRAIAAAAGVDGKTVATLRKAAEATAEIPRLPARTGADGKTRAAAAATEAPPARRTVRVKIAEDSFDQLVGRWVSCDAFRLVEIRQNVYELQVQLLGAAAASDDLQQEVERRASLVDALLGTEEGSSLAQLLGDATEIFGRPIGSTSDLQEPEAQWCVTRLVELAEHLEPVEA